MIKQLLEEVKAAPLDEASRHRLREIHQRSIIELEDGLAPELRDELERLSLPFEGETPPSESRAADRPGPAGRLAGGSVPRHPGRPGGPADGRPGAARADARRPAGAARARRGDAGHARPAARAVPAARAGTTARPTCPEPASTSDPKTFSRYAATPSLVVRDVDLVGDRPDGRVARWPSPPPRPAQVSIGMSLGMSPKASTSRAAMPSRSQTQASPAALVTPAAEISTSAAGRRVGGLGQPGQRGGDQLGELVRVRARRPRASSFTAGARDQLRRAARPAGRGRGRRPSAAGTCARAASAGRPRPRRRSACRAPRRAAAGPPRRAGLGGERVGPQHLVGDRVVDHRAVGADRRQRLGQLVVDAVQPADRPAGDQHHRRAVGGDPRQHRRRCAG